MATEEFLYCRQGQLPFIYLGLPIGAKVRNERTWEPMISKMQKRLGSWKNRFLSAGGRLVLLNLVLNSIPIYYLSVFKMLKLVGRKLAKLQRRFLWGGVSDNPKISWVKWQHVCLPKTKGGLGVRSLELVNYSLLGKWRWAYSSEFRLPLA